MNVPWCLTLILILYKELLTPNWLKLKVLLSALQGPPHPHRGKTWFVIPHVIPDSFGAGTVQFLGFYMNGWNIFFQYCFLQLFKSQTLRSELSSTLLLKLTLPPFLICYLSRDLGNAETWQYLSSKIYFPKYPRQLPDFLGFFSFLSHCAVPIFSLFVLSFPKTVEELYRLFWSLEQLPAQVIKRTPDFLWTIYLSETFK